MSIKARLEAIERHLAGRQIESVTMTPEEADRARQRILARLDAIQTETERDRVYGILSGMVSHEH